MVETTGRRQRAAIHAALADPGRLTIVDRLLISDASPTELRESVSMPSNLMAHHLKVLHDAGLIRRIRSEADRRRTYLRLDHDALEAMVPSAVRSAKRVLFVCSQNAARSQMAAAIWNRLSSVPVASAGTHPVDRVHPGALAAADRRGVSIEPRVPQHVDEVLARGDLVIAVCDNAHEELPADMDRLHWSVADPALSRSPDAFDLAFDDLAERIGRFSPNLQPI